MAESVFGKPIDNQVSELNSKIASLQMASIQYNYTVSAGGQSSANLQNIIDNSKPSGATVLGVVGFSSNDVNVFPISVRYANSNYSLQFKNTANGEITNHFDIYYLYII